MNRNITAKDGRKKRKNVLCGTGFPAILSPGTRGGALHIPMAA